MHLLLIFLRHVFIKYSLASFIAAEIIKMRANPFIFRQIDGLARILDIGNIFGISQFDFNPSKRLLRLFFTFFLLDLQERAKSWE